MPNITPFTCFLYTSKPVRSHYFNKHKNKKLGLETGKRQCHLTFKLSRALMKKK